MRDRLNARKNPGRGNYNGTFCLRVRRDGQHALGDGLVPVFPPSRFVLVLLSAVLEYPALLLLYNGLSNPTTGQSHSTNPSPTLVRIIFTLHYASPTLLRNFPALQNPVLAWPVTSSSKHTQPLYLSRPAVV